MTRKHSSKCEQLKNDIVHILAKENGREIQFSFTEAVGFVGP